MDTGCRLDFVLRDIPQLRGCPVFGISGGGMGILAGWAWHFAGCQRRARYWVKERAKRCSR